MTFSRFRASSLRLGPAAVVPRVRPSPLTGARRRRLVASASVCGTRVVSRGVQRPASPCACRLPPVPLSPRADPARPAYVRGSETCRMTRVQTGPQPEQSRARALLRWPERKERAFSCPSQSVAWSRNPARCGRGGSGPAWCALPGRQVNAGQAMSDVRTVNAAHTAIDTATLTRAVEVAQDAEEVVQEEEAAMARGGGAALPRARA